MSEDGQRLHVETERAHQLRPLPVLIKPRPAHTLAAHLDLSSPEGYTSNISSLHLWELRANP